MVNKEKVITIGGTGLVGSVLIKKLCQNFEVEDHSIDSLRPESRLDLTNTADFCQILDTDQPRILAVINLAAATDTNRAFNDPDYQLFAEKLNNFAPRDASLICRQLNIPFLHISTDFVYSGYKKLSESYSEEDQANPIEPYGETKYLGETAVLKNGGTVLTLAFPYVNHPLRPDLVEKFSSKLRTNLPVTAFYDQKITPTYIPDFIEVTRLLLAKLTKEPMILRGQKFHCVGSSFESPASIAFRIARHFNYDPTLIQPASVREYNQKALESHLRPYQENLALSNQKVCQATGFIPMTFRQALEEFPSSHPL